MLSIHLCDNIHKAYMTHGCIHCNSIRCCYQSILRLEWFWVEEKCITYLEIIIIKKSAASIQYSPTNTATKIPLILCSSTLLTSGLGPLDMMVRALAWVTDRTVAALSQGDPKREAIPPIATMRSKSKWKPEPFTNFLSGLLTISLQVGKMHQIPIYYVLPSYLTR